eukprot:RCo011140
MWVFSRSQVPRPAVAGNPMLATFAGKVLSRVTRFLSAFGTFLQAALRETFPDDFFHQSIQLVVDSERLLARASLLLGKLRGTVQGGGSGAPAEGREKGAVHALERRLSEAELRARALAELPRKVAQVTTRAQACVDAWLQPDNG